MNDRWQKRINLAADLATLALVVGVAAAFAMRHHGRGAAPTADPAAAWDSVVPAVQLHGVQGDTTLFATQASGSALVFVFRSDCHVCAAQREDWITLARMAHTHGVPVFGLTPEPLDTAVQAYFAPAPVRPFGIVNVMALGGTLHTSVVPTTLLVKDHRAVLLHRGLLDDTDVRDLTRMLGREADAP